MRTKAREGTSKAVRILFAIMLVVGLAPAAALTQARSAEAASGSGYLSVGANVDYAGFFTTRMDVGGNMAYCGNPSKNTPSAGWYTKQEVSAFIEENNYAVWNALYFGYGGPGFDAAVAAGIFPSRWYDGSAMDDDKYIALTHIILSGIYADDVYAAIFGTNYQFQQWCWDSILFGGTNYDSVEWKLIQFGGQQGFWGIAAFRQAGFEAFQFSTGSSTQHILSFDYNPAGWISLDKDSSNASITDGNDMYSLAGARYDIYSSRSDADARRNAVGSMTADNEGRATSGDLAPGTYYVRESESEHGTGYAVDQAVYEVQVPAGQTAAVGGGKVYDKPQNDPAAMWVGKIDLETSQNMPQGSASLAGAQFTVRYYDGLYGSAEAAEASGAPTRTWVVETDEDGFAMLDNAYKVSGDDFYTSSGGRVTVPLGTLLIQETKAPEGYVLPDPAPVYVRNVTAEGTGESVTTFNEPTQPEQIMRGGASIQKTDAETGGAALGAATLEGAVFSIVNESDHAVVVDGKAVEPGQEAARIATDEAGIASTATDLLPYGSYSATEVTAPEGYFGTSKKIEFSITYDKQFVELEGSAGFQNQVFRGDLEFTKKDEATSTAMAGIPFRLTSETTGESHIIVTDANGYASTSAEWVAHSKDMNGNDSASDGAYSADRGVWFGADAGARVDDSLGALPYDTYTLEEIACEANEGRELITQTGISITRDSVTVDLGTLDDVTPTIGTTASDAFDGDKTVAAGAHAAIVDRVSYIGLTPGDEYTVSGYLVYTDTAEPVKVGGEEVKASATFTPTSPNGTIDVRFDLGGLADGLAEGQEFRTTVYEELYKGGRLLADHKVLEDSGQQVRVVFPSIGTTATDGADGDKAVSSDPNAVIVDAVAYRNLEEGAEYRLVSAAVPYEAAGEVTAGDLKAAIGTAETTFVSEGARGEASVSVECDTTGLADGARIVMFEWVYDEAGNLVAEHVDPDDASQTVTVKKPSIGTAASDASDGDQTIVDDGSREVVLTDIVSYENLVPGREYTVSGTLMDKATGEALLGADGSPVTAETTFTPALSAGSVEVSFTFDPTSIPAGNSIVAFESLYLDGVEVAVHADIDDEAQTVEVQRPSIGTTAADGVDGDKTVVSDPAATIVDTIAVRDVADGAEYRLVGILMDSSTGLPYLQGEPQDGDEGAVGEWWSEVRSALGLAGEDPSVPSACDPDALARLLEEDIAQRTVTASKDFSLPDSWGDVEVSFGPFDASAMATGSQVVVFEALVNPRGDVVVAAHADIDDVGQTVGFKEPAIGTEAEDGLDGDKNIVAGPETTLVDTVEYFGLIPGRAYTMEGTLMVASTGEALLDADGNPITSTIEFTPQHESGSVELAFTFDSSLLVGDSVVAFESLKADGIEVAAHADIEDEDQTVAVTAPEVDTLAADGLDGDKTVVADPESEVVDTLAYSNVIPGEYVSHAFLMDASTGLPLMVGEGAEDVSKLDLESFWGRALVLLGIEQTGEPYQHEAEGTDQEASPAEQALEAGALGGVVESMAALEEAQQQPADDALGQDAEPVSQIRPYYSDWEGFELLLEENPEIAAHLATAITAFEATSPDGEIDARFGVDSSEIAGKRAVAFQVLTTAAEGSEAPLTVAYHADLADVDQSVDIVASEIGTEATDKTDGDHEILNSADAVVVDTVTYTDLIPGKEYELKGQLMDKRTGEQLIAADKPVEASIRFTPNQPDGQVQLEFRFDASALEGAQLVAFEHLYKDGIEVAAHADIDDEAQTVTVCAPPAGGAFDQTGRTLAPIIGGLALAATAGTILAVRGLRRRGADDDQGAA